MSWIDDKIAPKYITVNDYEDGVGTNVLLQRVSVDCEKGSAKYEGKIANYNITVDFGQNSDDNGVLSYGYRACLLVNYLEATITIQGKENYLTAQEAVDSVTGFDFL